MIKRPEILYRLYQAFDRKVKLGQESDKLLRVDGMIRTLEKAENTFAAREPLPRVTLGGKIDDPESYALRDLSFVIDYEDISILSNSE